MEHKIKIGDRVRVYGFCFSKGSNAQYVYATHICPVLVIELEKDNIVFNLEGIFYYAHYRQCRRVVKKLRQRLWLSQNQITEYKNTCDLWYSARISLTKISNGDVEFIEVRKK